MSHPFTEEHETFRQMVRRFVEKELAPHALEWDRAGIFPREVFRKCGELGLFGIHHDPRYGGSGLDYGFVTVLAEELARTDNAGVTMALLVQGQTATPILNEVGTEEQKREFLAPALAGEKIAAFGMSEPGAGSDLANLRTTARRVGNDYVINGSKMWITNGTRADFIILAVRTSGPGAAGISLVTFPTDVKGFQVSKKLEKVGNLSSDTAILYFEDCRIPARYVLGRENDGFFHIMNSFQAERLVTAINAVAVMQRMLEEAIRYGREREAFGKRLIDYQVWRHKFAEHLTAVAAARQLTYHTVELFQRKRKPLQEISMIKLYTGELAQRVAYDCQQFYGGMGYIEETNIARAWRDVRLLTIGGGTSEMMKEIIATTAGM
ncbi:acyl-CoA dehydrogenase family protein [Vitiosangium sp. GDMCC 1.1324]|uniref:acyl-CoA dehydrogenase family protein n=1 Tax=Vitiosangium sp. (strain GDMCC 1.1324) TaxID=2138576 RepID=UPI000D3560C7|nr:acyl-CoA dehydrogenase family protein [Vitiosangium sp. GDMCC 1.1324]PTL75060.1 acyl-CoA dehydrogenase [Vitiosangium sp. GDMCC 1.1324]